jgi:hypothetical protein
MYDAVYFLHVHFPKYGSSSSSSENFHRPRNNLMDNGGPGMAEVLADLD